MYLFGSQLLKKYFPDFREPQDFDYVINLPSSTYHTEVDYDCNGQRSEFYSIPCTPNREMTPDELYTLKVSHAIYDIHWSKTMSDIRFLQLKDCQIDSNFLSQLREYWKTIHTGDKYKRFDFSAKENIFNDYVDREIDHDQLHLLFNSEVMFRKFSDDNIPNQEKFEALPDEIKNKICTEEAYVIAIERFYDKFPMYKAYNNAQRLLITQLHPVFIADHAILNWHAIYKPKENFYDVYKRTNLGKNSGK